jgi:hypothetical protein
MLLLLLRQAVFVAELNAVGEYSEVSESVLREKIRKIRQILQFRM